MKLKYRLQTHNECSTLAVATAIEYHLSTLGPEYMIRVDVGQLEARGGIGDSLKTLMIAQEMYPWLQWDQSSIGDTRYPAVCTTWMNGFAHDITRVDDKNFYDPGQGKLVTFTDEQLLKTGKWIHVYSKNAPVVNKWLKFSVIRFIAKLFNLI